MKKIFAIITLSFYLMLSIGIIARVHFCHGTIEKLAIFESSVKCNHEYTEINTKTCCENPNNAANHCSTENTINSTESNCCDTQTLVIQFANNTQIVSQLFSLELYPIILSFTELHQTDDFKQTIVTSTFVDFSPPPLQEFYILYSSFIYYS